MSDAAPAVETARRGVAKSAAAFRTISEVATELDVPQHVLRFWETKFSHIRPLKRAGGRRYYRPEDIALLRRIKSLLYDSGYTIRGVQKLLREGAVRVGAAETAPVDPPAPTSSPSPSTSGTPSPAISVAASQRDGGDGAASARVRAEMEGVLDELKALRELLRRAR